MLTRLPAELLVNILSYLVSSPSPSQSSPRYFDRTVNEDAIYNLGNTSRSLQATTRDYRSQLLRSRLARIPHVDLLLAIWTPPTFFHRRRWASPPRDPHDLLTDPDMYTRVDAYLNALERRSWVASCIADYLLPLLAIPYSPDAQTFMTTTVLHLWSVQARYSHDIDGTWASVRDEARLEDLQDEYVRALPTQIQRTIIETYNALCRRLKPPFYACSGQASAPVGEGMWLWRLLVKDGMEPVLAMLQSSSR